jgi:hypothetical protein
MISQLIGPSFYESIIQIKNLPYLPELVSSRYEYLALSIEISVPPYPLFSPKD